MAEAPAIHDSSNVPLPYRREPACPFDPASDYRRLRAEEPVIRVPTPSGESVWLITRHADVRRVFGDTRFSSRQPSVVLERPPAGDGATQFSPPQFKGFFVTADGSEHLRYRGILAPMFTVREIGKMRPRIEKIVTSQLDALQQTGPEADLVAGFAQPVPGLVICGLLGVPHESRPFLHERLAKLEDLTLPHEQIRISLTEVIVFLIDFIQEQRGNPGQGVVGRLVREYGHELSDEELCGIAGMFLLAGYWPPANVLATGFLLLLRNPEQLKILRENPASDTSAVEEIMRYLSIVNVGQPRTATEDIEVDGQLIKSGEFVMCSLASANRDERFHEDGDIFDITRRPSPHVAFGYGPHQCLGQQLARMVFKIAIPALIRRFPEISLAVPFEDVHFFSNTVVHGLHTLPVKLWSEDVTPDANRR